MVAVLDILGEIPQALTTELRRDLFDLNIHGVTAYAANIDRVPLREVSTDNKQQHAGKKESHSANPSGHDHQNFLAHEAQIGSSIADNTALAATRKLDEKHKISQLIHGAAAFSQAVNFSNNPNFNIHLSGIKLDDPHMVAITDDNILMVRGDGPESELREATLSEKLQLEGKIGQDDGACSIAMTREELDMQAYLKGDVDQIPDSLHQLAEKNGYLAEDLSRDDFKGLLDKEFAENPHITARISSTLDSEASLLPPQQSLTPAPAPMM